MRFSSLSFKILLKFSSSKVYLKIPDFRIKGGSRAAATSKMECFVTIVKLINDGPKYQSQKYRTI